MGEKSLESKPNLNRPLTEFPEKLLTFLEVFGNYLPEDFLELSTEQQFHQIINACDLSLKSDKNYILVDADMTLRDLFTNG